MIVLKVNCEKNIYPKTQIRFKFLIFAVIKNKKMQILNIKTIDNKIEKPGKATVYEVTRVFMRDNKLEYVKGKISEAEYKLFNFLQNSGLSNKKKKELVEIIEDYGQDQYNDMQIREKELVLDYNIKRLEATQLPKNEENTRRFISESGIEKPPK